MRDPDGDGGWDMGSDRFQIGTRNDGIASEISDDKVILEGQEVGGNEGGPGIIRVEGTDEGGRVAGRIVFKMNGTLGEDGRAELVEGIRDERRAGLGNELREDLTFGNNDEFIRTRMQVGENQAAGLDVEDGEGGIEAGEEGCSGDICEGDIAGCTNDGDTLGGIGKVEREGCVAAIGSEDLVARDGGVCLFKVKLKGGRGVVVNDVLRGRNSQDGRGDKERKEVEKHCGDDGR